MILLDLMMPIMDGQTFCAEQLKELALSPIPVIVISAFRDVEQATTGLNVSAWMKKPIRLEDLVTVVETLCPPGAAA